jgi:L-lactate dehydrogenase complex protein LldG
MDHAAMTDPAAARADVLAAIKAGLRDEPARELPAPAPVFPPEALPDAAALAASFSRELAALSGETRMAPSATDLPGVLARLLEERGLKIAAVQNSSRVSAALAQVPGDRFFQAAGASPQRIEAADCGIIEANALLADTGSVVAIFKNRGERLLPFLPPTCVVLADAGQLRPHMDDDALKDLYGAARDGARGEGVIITGPSRSADIEKVLVLGAHGPRALIVLIVGAPF